MNVWQCRSTGLLLLAVLLSTASAHNHPNCYPIPSKPTVSPWAQAEVKKAQELGLVPNDGFFIQGSPCTDYRLPISRDEFAQLAMQFIAVQEHCDRETFEDMVAFYFGEKNESRQLKQVFTDARETETLASLIGVVKGKGNGIFDPEALITRQEAAVMLSQAYGTYGGTFPKETQAITFQDEEIIADWAKGSTSILASWKVMNGMGDSSFAPQGYYTIEQSIVTFLRLYENTPVSRKHSNIKPLFTYQQGMTYLESIFDGNAYRESYRLEGPVTTFFRGELEAMHSCTLLYFIYRDGGIKSVDLGICNDHIMGLPTLYALKLENLHFSEDGKTFFCSASITPDSDVIILNGRPLHEYGIYHITIDVDTCQYQLQREALPQSLDAMEETL